MQDLKETLYNNISLGSTTPMANEFNTAIDFIEDILVECDKYGFKTVTYFVIFDNTCNDGTYELLKNYSINENRLRVVFEPDNRCVVDAYVKGYEEAIMASCDWILEIDAGYSHLPSEISRFFEKMGSNYDCVFGSRFIKGGVYQDAPILRYILSKWGSLLVNLIMRTKLRDMTSGFEIFKKEVLFQLLQNNYIQSKNTFFQTEIRFYCHKYNIVEVPITYSNPSLLDTKTAMYDALKDLYFLYKKNIL